MAMTDQPAWLAAAWRELGQKEIGGAADNARIVAYFRDAGHAYVADDETAWCAAFVGAMLERCGLTSTRSLRARSYLAWGEAIAEPRLGAVAVLTRGADPALGHVGFVVGETDGRLVLLGGNQGNAVAVSAFDRARMLSLRWPQSEKRETQSAGQRPDAKPDDFDAALAHVLAMEGGFSDDPYDPGGPTNFGITLRTYAAHTGRALDASSQAALIAELRAIAPQTVRAIYRTRYWEPARCPTLPPALALFHFDAAVNHGVGTAIRALQEALPVAVDGEIGPITERAIRTSDVRQVIARYAAIRERRYRALKHFWRFGRGWLNRVAATKAAALQRLAADERSTPPAPVALEPSTQLTTQGDTSMTSETGTTAAPKWWGRSLTVWGAFVTAAAAIVPALGPLVGVDVSSEAVRQIGADIGGIVQALAGTIGTLMTLYGRARATMPLVRRDVSVKL